MKVRARVLYLDDVPDATGEVIDPAGLTYDDREVPVRLGLDRNEARYCGKATLHRDDRGLVADVSIMEAVLPFDLAVRFTPHVEGMLAFREGTATPAMHVREDGVTVLERTHIRELFVTSPEDNHPHADRRIKSFGEQVLAGEAQVIRDHAETPEEWADRVLESDNT